MRVTVVISVSMSLRSCDFVRELEKPFFEFSTVDVSLFVCLFKYVCDSELNCCRFAIFCCMIDIEKNCVV